MIEAVLPSAVASAETRGRLAAIELSPIEADCLGDAVERRREEFVTGRACARRALERLGTEVVAIGAGERGEPLWPAGVVGSITHCPGYCACAVARSDEIAAVGIDAEPHDALPDGVLDAISSRDERIRIAEGPGHLHMDRLLFSAKEALYKVWYPLTGQSLGFEDADVVIDPLTDPLTGTFSACVLASVPTCRIHGRWRVEDGIVVTAAFVPHPGPGRVETA